MAGDRLRRRSLRPPPAGRSRCRAARRARDAHPPGRPSRARIRGGPPVPRPRVGLARLRLPHGPGGPRRRPPGHHPGAAGARHDLAAHRAQPDNPVWLVRVARMRFAAGDSAFVDSVLPGLVRTHNPEALLFAAALAARRGDQRRRAALLREALARGGDTAEADAGLAAVAARDADWPGTAAALRRSLAVARATYRHPFPAGLLHDPLAALALTGPIRLADSVLAAAGLAHPGWTTPYELRAAIALRDGRCEDAASQFLALAEFGIEVADAPDRLMRCRGPERR